jgi:hypothetical protein
MFVNIKKNNCFYCNKIIPNHYEHLISVHNVKLLKILAIKNHIKKNKIDYKDNDLHYIISDVIIAKKLFY